MATINLKTFCVKFTRSIMLNTGKKISHLDSDDSTTASDEEGEKQLNSHSSEPNFKNSSKYVFFNFC